MTTGVPRGCGRTQEDAKIREGTRGRPFRELIERLLSPVLSKEYLPFLLTDDCLEQFSIAFTSKVANSTHNYERYEQLGDVSINKFIVNYMYFRFPQLNHPDGVDPVARLKIKFASKEQLQALADNEGFWPFITCSTNEKRKDKLEDVFEAFCGVTETLIDLFVNKHVGGHSLSRKDDTFIGVGFHFVYQFLKTQFDRLDISLQYEDLVMAKTILNELSSERKDLNTEFDTVQCANGRWTSHVIGVWQDGHRGRETLGTGTAAIKKDAEEAAAKHALKTLQRKYNIYKQVPKRYRQFWDV